MEQVIVLEEPVGNYNIYLNEEGQESPSWKMHYDSKNGYQGPYPIKESAINKIKADRIMRNAFHKFLEQREIHF